MTGQTLKKLIAFGFFLIFLTALLILLVFRPYVDVMSTEKIAELALAVSVVLIAAILCAVLVSLRITKSIVKPIEKLGEAPDNIEALKKFRELQPFISELKEQRKKQKALSKQKKQFTANLSHELKTPLTSIAGYAELIESGIAKEEDIKPFASTIRKQALRLVSVSEDIIKLSQLEENDEENTVSFSSVDIYEIAGRCIKALSINAQLRNISISLAGESAFVNGNSSLLEELIYNLCDNAIRYNKENGDVFVSIQSDKKGVTLAVEDTGIGIEEKYQERIFERFFRVDKSRSKETGGTGLGLAIVKHIAQLHAAELTIDSKIGCGTKISIFFSK